MHVSTAYVAGDRRVTAYEDDAEHGAFRNAYEQTKHEAERLVRASGLPWTIARPSIVVGESDSGWTSSFNVLYGPLRAFAAGAYRERAQRPVEDVEGRRPAAVALAHHDARARDGPRQPAGAHEPLGFVLGLLVGVAERAVLRVVLVG